MPDLVEVYSDSDDKEDADNDDSNTITEVPVNNTSTTKNVSPAVPSNRPSDNTPPRKVSLALTSNMPYANTSPTNMPPKVASNRPSTNTLGRNVPIKTYQQVERLPQYSTP